MQYPENIELFINLCQIFASRLSDYQDQGSAISYPEPARMRNVEVEVIHPLSEIDTRPTLISFLPYIHPVTFCDLQDGFHREHLEGTKNALTAIYRHPSK